MKPAESATIIRSALLFVNFFLIITALYQLKPSSRSMILDVVTAARLPYVWILSAAVLFVSVAVYQRLLKRYRRQRVVLGATLMFASLLVLFRLLLQQPGVMAPVAFYIFVDLVGVVLVEQFWSLANSLFSTRDGKRWYGLIGTGGLIGGGAGSVLAAALVQYTSLETPDLLLVAAFILGLIFVLTALMGRLSLYDETRRPAAVSNRADSRPRRGSTSPGRYLALIAAALLMAQLITPLVEFQFMKIVEVSYPEREARTAMLGYFFSVMSMASMAINLVVTPLILRRLGVLAGMMVQPLLLALSAWGFTLYPGFHSAAIMKISDRGLSYSITRSARELLYIPVDPVVMYRAKGWIDMFGYSVFKMFGAVSILFLTQWTSLERLLPLNHVIVLACLLWAGLLVVLHRDYRKIRLQTRAANRTMNAGLSETC